MSSLTAPAPLSVPARHAATFHGEVQGGPLVVLAHGFGCDQGMWDLVIPQLTPTLRVLTFDYVGAGSSDLSAYDPVRHASLEGYAQDLVALLDALDAREVVLVGHSVSAMIAAHAYPMRPERFAGIVMVGPSPRYVDDAGYLGGFSLADIETLLDTLASNYLGWSAAMAPVIMGNADRPELSQRLERSFCRTDPEIAEQFARVTFLSDSRAQLAGVHVPTLVLQCSEDAIAPRAVGHYVADQLPRGVLVELEAGGHCPHVSAPEETSAAIREFISTLQTEDDRP